SESGDDCIQCPFHGWRFGGDGQCKRIPNLNETEPTITGKMTIYLLGVELITLPTKLCHVSPVTDLLYIGTDDSLLGTILVLGSVVPLQHSETLARITLFFKSSIFSKLYLIAFKYMLNVQLDSDAMILINSQSPQRPILTRNDEAIVSYDKYCSAQYPNRQLSTAFGQPMVDN
ncbi:unnamed protein product, partial [Medioppia subpectinata]